MEGRLGRSHFSSSLKCSTYPRHDLVVPGERVGPARLEAVPDDVEVVVAAAHDGQPVAPGQLDGEVLRVGDVRLPEDEERPLVRRLPTQGHTTVQVQLAPVQGLKLKPTVSIRVLPVAPRGEESVSKWKKVV